VIEETLQLIFVHASSSRLHHLQMREAVKRKTSKRLSFPSRHSLSIQPADLVDISHDFNLLLCLDDATFTDLSPQAAMVHTEAVQTLVATQHDIHVRRQSKHSPRCVLPRCVILPFASPSFNAEDTIVPHNASSSEQEEVKERLPQSGRAAGWSRCRYFAHAECR
jgi:hypothetical protein